MLKITVKGSEMFNQETQEFVMVGPNKPVTITLEHSLISISKWEAKWKKPFLSTANSDISKDELLDYINCMSLTGDIPIDVINAITLNQFNQILSYVNDNKTATTITEHNKSNGGRDEILTSELIYYYMAAFHLPFYAEKWHLSRLLMLIKVANAKSNPQKMSKNEILKENARINAMRRKAMHSKG